MSNYPYYPSPHDSYSSYYPQASSSTTTSTPTPSYETGEKRKEPDTGGSSAGGYHQWQNVSHSVGYAFDQHVAAINQRVLDLDPGSSSGGRKRKRAYSRKTQTFEGSADMLAELTNRIVENKPVNFTGSYTVLNDPPIPDKNRVQQLAHDIWTATGYRFTVKDHPPLANGHKTRFWCSQDAARKNRHGDASTTNPTAPNSAVSSSMAPGMSTMTMPSMGSSPPSASYTSSTVAKERFWCRSSLLISCQDPSGAPASTAAGPSAGAGPSQNPGPSGEGVTASGSAGGAGEGGSGATYRSVTLRLHHELQHEPYSDAGAPRFPASNTGTGPGTSTNSSTSAGSPYTTPYGQQQQQQQQQHMQQQPSTPQISATPQMHPSHTQVQHSHSQASTPTHSHWQSYTPVPPHTSHTHSHSHPHHPQHSPHSHPHSLTHSHSQHAPQHHGHPHPHHTHYPPESDPGSTSTISGALGAHGVVQGMTSVASRGTSSSAPSTLPEGGEEDGDASVDVDADAEGDDDEPEGVGGVGVGAGTAGVAGVELGTDGDPGGAAGLPAAGEREDGQDAVAMTGAAGTRGGAAGPSADDVFRERMMAHIQNIRDFCDGLEYQVQFNDWGMLSTLEREGAGFLKLVQDCLEREGRLRGERLS